jgi:putative membrane protein
MYYFWGMHWYWWFFWVFLWIVFFSFTTPMRRTTYRQMQSPLQLLQRRYAAGEITRNTKNGGPNSCGMRI